MRLADVLSKENIIVDLKARRKSDVLDEMVAEISRAGSMDREKVLSALLEREKLGTTGIGHGVAIPHGKIRGIADIRVFFGRSRAGVDFDSMDKMPVHLIFLIIAPENSASAHLKILASISHLLKNMDFRETLMKAESGPEIYRAIMDADRRNTMV